MLEGLSVMIHSFAIRFADFLVNEDAVKNENRDEYVYRFEILVEKAIVYLVFFQLAIGLKLFAATVFFLLFFMTLRGWTGGFHASTYFRCFVGTIGIYLVCVIVLIPYFKEHQVYLLFLLVIASIFVFFLHQLIILICKPKENITCRLQ